MKNTSFQKALMALGFWTSAGMFAALAVAVALAMGHHFFYAHLAGTTMPEGDFWKHSWFTLSRQQFNLTIGNAFAFLIKASLGIAVSIAYAQLFWQAIQSQPAKISSIDVMYSALSDLTTVARVKVWWRHPLLLLFVLIIWYDTCGLLWHMAGK